MKLRCDPRVLTGSVALFLLLLTACRQQKPLPAPPPPAVTTQQPILREVIEWDEYPGRLEPVEMVEVRARVNGYLESVHFQEGAMVKKGDLLFVIDARPYQAEFAKQKAAVVQAETRLAWAQTEVARAERLVKSRAISDEEAESRQNAQREAQAGLEAARAALDAAQLNLDYTRITAPISGRISRKLITEGNLVNGNQGQSTLLTTIVSVDPIYCYFDADERSIQKYQQMAREGTGSSLRGGDVVCELELANEKDFPHKGRLDFVDNRVNPGTGTLRVRGVFPNPGPDFLLQPGFFARVRVPGSGRYPALLVPDQAIGTDQGQKFVYAVNAEETVEYKQVQLGPVIDGLRVIRKGVTSNDWILVNGLMSVRPGVKVRAQKAAAVSAEAGAGQGGSAE